MRQTLRNARFIGEMAFKGLEREIRARISRPSAPKMVESPVVPDVAETTEVVRPFEGYELLTAGQIIAQSKAWSFEQKAAAHAYEAATRNRRSVLQALS